MEIVGIPSSVYQNQLEGSVCKTFEKLNCNIVTDNLDCHRWKCNRVIVKFSKRKDCKQALSVKKDLKNIDIDWSWLWGLYEWFDLYHQKLLCSYYKMLWSWSKKLPNMGIIYSWLLSGGTIEIKISEHGNFFHLFTHIPSLSIFLTSIWQHFITVNKFIISCLLLSWVFIVFIYC